VVDPDLVEQCRARPPCSQGVEFFLQVGDRLLHPLLGCLINLVHSCSLSMKTKAVSPKGGADWYKQSELLTGPVNAVVHKFHLTAKLFAEVFGNLAYASLFVLHKRLVCKADFLKVLAQLALDYTLNDLSRLVHSLGLSRENCFRLGNICLGYRTSNEVGWIERRGAKREVLSKAPYLLGRCTSCRSCKFYEHANPAFFAVDVVDYYFVRTCGEDFEAANLQVLFYCCCKVVDLCKDAIVVGFFVVGNCFRENCCTCGGELGVSCNEV